MGTTVGWVQLKTKHREVLQSQAWLDNKLMNAAQTLLHPHIRGLQDTLLQYNNTFDVPADDFIQWLNLGGCYWITISTLGCLPSVVRVYDNMKMVLYTTFPKQNHSQPHTHR